jgi:hypothetical protein
MAARIQNRAILQALTNFLKLQGPEGPPSDLNIDDLKIVVNIPLNALPDGFAIQNHILNNIAIGGTNENTLPLLSRGEDGSADVTGKNYRLMAFNANIVYTAAGAIAAAGNKIGVFLIINDLAHGDSYLAAYNYDNGKTVGANITTYRFTMGTNVSGDISLAAPIPLNLFIGPDTPGVGASTGITFSMAPFSISAAGVLTNFPAGTSLFTRTVYYECNKPAIPPN